MSKNTNTHEVDDEILSKGAEQDSGTVDNAATPTDPIVDEGANQTAGPLYQVVAPRGLNLRADPGREHRILRVLSCGSVVEARGDAVNVAGASWLPVQDGWVDASFLVAVAGEV